MAENEYSEIARAIESAGNDITSVLSAFFTVLIAWLFFKFLDWILF